MFRRLPMAIALATALAVLPAVPTALRPVEAADRQPTPPPESVCVPSLTQEIHPKLLLLGETTTVTVTFGAICPRKETPFHLVLVLDTSAAMQGEPGRELRKKAVGVIQSLHLPEIASTQAGIVAFNSDATTLVQLTNDEDRLLASLERLASSGGSDGEQGLSEGLRMLERGRRDVSPWKRSLDGLVLISDGEWESGCNAAVAAAKRVGRAEIIVSTIPATRDADKRCLQKVARTPRYYLDGVSPWEQLWTYRHFDYFGTGITQFELTHALPANMDIVDGSVKPPAQVSPDGKTVSGIHRPAKVPGISYQLRPTQAGSHPISLETRADFVDAVRARGSVTATSAEVTVLAPQR